MGTPVEAAVGLTSAKNLANQASARATLNEDVVTPEQTAGSTVQSLADAGIDVGPLRERTGAFNMTPVVQEALRRRSLQKRQEQAKGVLGGADPLSAIFGLFGNATAPTTAPVLEVPPTLRSGVLPAEFITSPRYRRGVTEYP